MANAIGLKPSFNPARRAKTSRNDVAAVNSQIIGLYSRESMALDMP